jgi:hypothetical protein
MYFDEKLINQESAPKTGSGVCKQQQRDKQSKQLV